MTLNTNRSRFDLAATVLQDGHVDRITGPRCMAKMAEGPNVGRYVVVNTDTVLTEGTRLIVDTITGRAKPAPDGETDDRPSEVIVREMRDNDWPDRQSGNDT